MCLSAQRGTRQHSVDRSSADVRSVQLQKIVAGVVGLLPRDREPWPWAPGRLRRGSVPRAKRHGWDADTGGTRDAGCRHGRDAGRGARDVYDA